MRRRKLIRLILLVIVTGVVCLAIANLLHFRSEQVSENVGLVEEIRQPFWLLRIEPTQSFEYKKRTHCRHTQQHPSAAVDDLGVYCNRSSLLPHGCCPNPNSNSSPPSGTVNSRRNSTASVRFACDTCDRNHCCSTYEFCVSCCLKPSNLPLWRELFGQALRFKQRHLLLSTNPFELCQAKCRTSSLSVHHENTYRDSSKRNCFGWESLDFKS
ncbi:UPF0454 protein C12orf49 [Fasciola gigantica]|uniref:SREBP regulating gene protein n=1 Tax=Fasciola gigantica TaxID=46835 RepID=A0A504YUK3_FASGI|nr:UPF0454 protein C12orf49 [Fasciola gigantica]